MYDHDYEKLPPEPMVDLQSQSKEEVESSLSRVTYRTCLVRERGGEEYQTFPPPAWQGCEVPISHKNPAFIMPDMSVGEEPLHVDLAWVKEPRMVCLLNKTRWKGVSKPNQKQIDAINRSVILISLAAVDGKPHGFRLRICPGEFQPLLLGSGTAVHVKAEAGSPVLSVFGA